MKKNVFLLSCLLSLYTVALFGQQPVDKIYQAFHEPADKFLTVQTGGTLLKTHCKLFRIASIWE